MSLTNKTFIGFIWTAGGKLANAVAQIGVLAVLARLIDAESFGLVQAALIVVGFANIISQMGIGPALVQRKELTKEHIRVGFTFSLALGISLGLIIFFSASYIASFFDIPGLTPVIKVVSALFFFESYITVSSSLIQREMKLKERAIVEICSYFLGYGLIGIIFGYLGYDYWALVFAVFAQQIIKTIAYSIIRKHSLVPLWDKQKFKELFYFGGGFTIGKFLNYFANQGDNIITGRYLGAESLGIYSRAYALMSRPVGLIGDSIDKALFPAMAARQQDTNRLTDGFIKGSQIMFFVCIPMMAVIMASAKEIVDVLLGSDWEAAIYPLQILTMGLYFKMGYKMGDNLCRATGKVYKRANRQLIYVIAIISGTYIGAKTGGVAGVAYGVFFAVGVNYLFMIGLSLKILRISWLFYLKNLFSKDALFAVAFSLIYLIVYFIFKVIVIGAFWILIGSYIVFGISCLTVIYYFGHRLNFLKILPFTKKLNKFLKHPIQ